MPPGSDMSSLHDFTGKTKSAGRYHCPFRGLGHGKPPCPGGPSRRFIHHNHPVKTTPYFTQPKWEVGKSMAEKEVVLKEGADTEEGTKLYISNLDYEVSNSDIELLFSDIGHVKYHTVHYDRSGRSKGTAEVIYVHHSDALTAIERYNNNQLDGKTMKIELVGKISVTNSVTKPPITSRLQGKPSAGFQRNLGSGRGTFDNRGLFHGCGTGGFGHGRGRGQMKPPHEKVEPHPEKVKKQCREKVTVEELDADLDEFRRKFMQKKKSHLNCTH